MYVKMEGNVGYEFKCTVYDLIVQQLMTLCAIDDITEKLTLIDGI